jgi:hypothetical protein
MGRLCGLAVLVSACSPLGYLHADLNRAAIVGEPKIKTIVDPTVDVSQRTTVLLVPTSESGRDGTDPVVERQLLFLLRSELEARGYRVVSAPDDAPELLATVRLIDELVTSQVPAHVESWPVWVPPQQWRATTQSTGSFTSSGLSDFSYGNFQGTANTTVTQPGYMTSQPVYVGPKSTVAHIAAVGVDVFDVEANRVVWKGAAVAKNQASDGRFTGHTLLKLLIAEVPAARSPAPICSGGWAGIDVKLVSLDANSFVAVVTRANSDARNAGVVPGQLLESVARSRVTNRTYAQIISSLCGAEGTSVEVGVWDGEAHRTLTLRRTPVSGASWD